MPADSPDPEPLTTPELRTWLRRRLLTWFRAHRRDLPWRRTRDPYAVWVSEVMLQQTLVATVVPYFNRFLDRFPTVAALAAADEQDVLRLWEGLGYYRRARNLLRAARQVVTEHGGAFPRDPALVARLPGFGRYTVGAVLSQAFDRRLPILEANSLRVLCRLFALAGNPKAAPLNPRLWRLAEELLPARNVGDFNQAIMELGALVCTPAKPRCGECPLRERCAAHRLGLQDKLPEKAAEAATVPQEEAAVVVRRGEEVLVVQRPAAATRWANLWEFPHGLLQTGETYEAAAGRVLAELTGLRGRVGGELLTVRHGVTRFAITLVCFEAEYLGGEFRSDFYQKGLWVRTGDLHDYPFSSPQRRLARALDEPGRQLRLF